MRSLISSLILMSMISAQAYAQLSDDFKNSWVAKTLALQRQIDVNVPMNQATFIGTHNSENSVAYQIPFVRYVDPNQQISIYDQLEMGVRSIEFDVHWYTGTKFSKDVLLCHGLSNHLGCSVFDRPVVEGLEELRNWLQTNPNEVVFLYFDRALDGHEPRLAFYLNNYVGNYIFRPASVRASTQQPASCVEFPTTLSKADILKAGKQLIIVTKGCDVDAYQEQDRFPIFWNDVVFAGIGESKGANPYRILDSSYDDDFKDYPLCAKQTVFVDDPQHKNIWRIFEDRTVLSSMGKPTRKLYSNDIKDLMRCDVNWPTMDMLTINDERLAANIWSWAPNYPMQNQGECAVYKNGEGIENVPCTSTTVSGFVCQNKQSLEFQVVPYVGHWEEGEKVCQASAGIDWHFATPINGGQMYSLKEKVHNLPEIWLNYRLNAKGVWDANF